MFKRSDDVLITQALSGKKSAWITLVKRYEKGIYNYALRMVNNHADAMDLMIFLLPCFATCIPLEQKALLRGGYLK